MIGFLSSARDEANKLYSELSDAYQTALSLGVDRMHPGEIADADAKVKLAAKAFRGSDEVALSTTKSIYEELMPKLKAWIREKEQKYPGMLPPAYAVPPKFPTAGGEVEIEPTLPVFSAGAAAGVGEGAGQRPWYLAGGIDWRVIGGVSGGLLLLTWWMRRRRR